MIIHPTIKFHTNHNKFEPSHYTLHVQVLFKVLASIEHSMSPLLPNEVDFLVFSIR